MNPLLEVQNLSHRFEEGNWGLKNVNLQIRQGDFLALCGPNGSGKSLLMRHLIGLLDPTEGAVHFQGKSIKNQLLHVRKNVGLVFQNPDHQILAPQVVEEVAFGLRNLGCKEKDILPKVERALGQMGLLHKKSDLTHYLSGGEKKRLTLAGVLVMDPQVIIFDEPFIGLDRRGVIELLECMKDLHLREHTILVISHDIEKFLALANRMVLMKEGSILKEGNPMDMLPFLEDIDVHCPYNSGQRSQESFTWLP